MTFWNLLIAHDAAELAALTRIDAAVNTARNVSVDVSRLLRDQHDTLELVHQQAEAIQRLQMAVRVMGELLIECGALEPDGLESRVNTALQAEKNARDAQKQARDAQRRARAEAAAEAERQEKAERAKQAAVPVDCRECGEAFPYRSMTLTEHGLICSSCRATAEGAT